MSVADLPTVSRAAGRAEALRSEQATATREGALATKWTLGFEVALQILGQGFLDHPANEALHAAALDQSLSAEHYLSELFGLVYRCVLLFSAEARGCLHPEGSAGEARRRCARLIDSSWPGLQAVFRGLAHGEPRLALPALGGIFSEQRCSWLDAAQLDDGVLASALGSLGWRRAGSAPAAAALPPAEELDWAELTPEQLGSAYENLLGLRPALQRHAGQLRWRTREELPGGLRRRTGSYYTPDRLVQTLLDEALEPVVQGRIAAHSQQPARALCELAVVDPACGAGYFLLGAARRLARHVARSATPGEALSDYRTALRHVLGQCCFGVDLNPMAVEVCRLGFWLEAADASLPLSAFDAHVVQGHSLLGATPEWLAQGVPDAAWKALPDEDRRVARELELRNRRGAADPVNAEHSTLALEPAHEKLLADAWCAAFIWPKQPQACVDFAPTNELWLRAWRGGAGLPLGTRQVLVEIVEQQRFFHWHLEFAEVFARGGFDLVLGNPPWIAHAGRASQRLPPAVKRFFACNFPSFADYPTTHGMFVHLAARVLRDGGYLGLVVPSSLSELGGYLPTRVAHDQLCDFPGELLDFGEGQFAGVTQPCMALVSRRCASGRQLGGVGQPWPVQRRDLDGTARALIARLAALPTLPPGLFGERGVQSDRELLKHFLTASAASGRFCTPIREGTDVREFELRAPRWHVDREALGARMRTAEEFRRVSVLVRQTARYPIAALSDGTAFRNSLLAAFETPAWPAPLLVALLNSALIRWLHYMRFRDARQPILPQLKIAHLRSIPAPPAAALLDAQLERLAELGQRSSAQLVRGGDVRPQLDELVFELYELGAAERELVSRWYAENAPRPRPRAHV